MSIQNLPGLEPLNCVFVHNGETVPLTARPLWNDLMTAVQAGDGGAIRALVGRAVPVDFELKQMDNEAFSKKMPANFHLPPKCRCPLFEAAWASQNESLQILLEVGADPNWQVPDEEGQTPLLLAAFDGNIVAMRALLDHKADPALAQPDGTTPLMKALLHDRHAAALLLLEHAGTRCAVNARRSYEGLEGCAVHLAAQTGDFEIMKRLLQHGAHLEERDGLGRTPLLLTFWTASEGWSARPESKISQKDLSARVLKTAKVLLRAGANPGIRDNVGHTAYTYAHALNRKGGQLKFET